MQHFDLYSKLRAALLSRHFATDRGRPMHLFSTGGILFHPAASDPKGETNALIARPDLTLEAFEQLPEAEQRNEKSVVEARWTALTPQQKLAARERAAFRNGENPWLMFAPMAVALGVELRLGLQPAKGILDGALDAFAAMFRCSGRFAGYPIRWDPVASEPGTEHWNGPAYRSGDFLLDAQGRYMFSTPLTDLRSHPWRHRNFLLNLLPPGSDIDAHIEAMYQHHRACQRWEPSQDEVFGLLAVAWASGLFSGNATLRARAAGLLQPLARYLADHGYLLVRPGGGLVTRGHGDSLVGAELAIGHLFESLLGNRHRPVTDWKGAITLAGLWPSVEPGWTAGSIVGGAIDFLQWMGTLGNLFRPALTQPSALSAIASLTTDPTVAGKVGRFIGIATAAPAFDSYKRGEGSGDPALSAFLHEFTDPHKRFDVFMTVMAVAPYKAPGSGFVPVFSLFGLDATDNHVRDSYLAWFLPRQNQATEHTPLFALAVACVLAGDGRWEVELRDRLNQQRDLFEKVHGAELPVELVQLDLTGNRWTLAETALPAVDYCAALALAWFHAQRALATGRTLPSDFPVLPAPLPTLTRPALPGTGDLFPNDRPRARPQEGSTLAEEMPDLLLPPDVDIAAFPVPANGGDRDTGEDIHFGDVFQIDAGPGSVTFPGESFRPIGAIGHPRPSLFDAAWPVHLGQDPRARAYALVGRLNGWFHIGTSTGQQRWLYRAGHSRRLFLRVNQDVNKAFASGAFTARIRIWRHAQADSPIRITRAEAQDWSILPPHIAFSYMQPDENGNAITAAVNARLTLSVSLDGGPWEVVHAAALGFGAPAGRMSNYAVSGDAITIHRVFWTGQTDRSDYRSTNGLFRFRISLVVAGKACSATCETSIRWHGERIQCVERGAGRLLGVGGVMPNNRRWRLSVPEAIAEIDRGQSFHVEEPSGDRVAVYVDTTTKGRRYLRTQADGDRPNNLRHLPACPT